MSQHIVTMSAPVEEQIGGDGPDGTWRMSPRDRLRATRTMAVAMSATWLPPYVPRYDRSQGRGGWETTVGGYLRATTIRALRWHFGDSARLASDCLSCRVLALAAAFKERAPDVQWADMGDVAAWPMALRLDARRLEERFAAVSSALWCRACDDAPSASAGRWCLWCERQGDVPATMGDARMAA